MSDRDDKKMDWTGRALAAAIVSAAILVACGSDISPAMRADAAMVQSVRMYAVVVDDARIYHAPSLDAGSVAFNVPDMEEAVWQAGLTMTLVEARDGWVRVQSRPFEFRSYTTECAENRARGWVTRNVVWDGWVQESDLIPVFAADTRVDFSDGTWAEFAAGTMIQDDPNGQAHALVRLSWGPTWAVPIQIEGIDVRLSFATRLAEERAFSESCFGPDPQLESASIGGVPIPRAELTNLCTPSRNPAEAEDSWVEIVSECARARIRVESVNNYTRAISCGHFFEDPIIGSVITPGARVRSTSGDVVGHVRRTMVTGERPIHVPGDLVCFSMRALRQPILRRLGYETAGTDDLACFRPEDVMLDPIWPLREDFGATVRDPDSMIPIWLRLEPECSTCRYTMDFVLFVMEHEPETAFDIAILHEFHLGMRRETLLSLLRRLGDDASADTLTRHYKDLTSRLRQCGMYLCMPDWTGP